MAKSQKVKPKSPKSSPQITQKFAKIHLADHGKSTETYSLRPPKGNHRIPPVCLRKTFQKHPPTNKIRKASSIIFIAKNWPPDRPNQEHGQLKRGKHCHESASLSSVVWCLGGGTGGSNPQTTNPNHQLELPERGLFSLSLSSEVSSSQHLSQKKTPGLRSLRSRRQQLRRRQRRLRIAGSESRPTVFCTNRSPWLDLF